MKLKVMSNTNWWAKAVSEVLAELKTDLNGLTQQEAERRLTQDGPNDIKISGTNFFYLLVKQFTNPLIILLFLAGLASLLLGEILDFYLILAVIIFQIGLTFFQEYNAEKILQSLNKLLEVSASVLRQQQWQSILAKRLVVGDIVKISFGDIVPADLRLFRTFNLQVNEAILTGESAPVEKTAEVLTQSNNLPEQRNLSFKGTTVIEGEGFGIVIETGARTQLGQLSEEIKKVETPSPLRRDIKKLSQFITVIILAGVALLLGLDFWRSGTFGEILPTMIALTVSSIPEGLPIALTLILLLGSQRLLKHNVLIRNLSAVDAFARLDLCLLDKTGTITKGEISLAGVLVEKELINYQEWEKEKPELLPKDLPRHFLAVEMASLCFSSSSLIGKNLIGFLEKLDLNIHDLRNKYYRLDSIPFNPFDKYSVHLFRNPVNGKKSNNQDKQNYLAIVGAPEKLIEKATSIWLSDKIVALDLETKTKLANTISHFTQLGFYTIGLGYKESRAEKITSTDTIPIFGLLIFQDLPRPDTAEILDQLEADGIDLYLLTGDHKLVAQKVGFDINLIKSPAEVYDLSENTKLPEKLEPYKIYSRVTPYHKKEIVTYFQKKNKIIGMIGDGVNDIPSLRQSDIGIALGSGAPAAQEAADMVLLDNNLKSLLLAFQQGQNIIGTIQKVIGFLMLMSFDLLVTFLLTFLMGLPYPVTTSQILFTNFFEDSFLSLNFILNPVNYRKKSVFDKHFGYFLTSALTVFIGVVLLFMVSSSNVLSSAGVDYWRTVVFTFFYFNAMLTSVAFFSLPHSFLLLFKKEHFKGLAPVILMVLILLFVFQSPVIAQILHLQRLAVSELGLIAAFLLINLILLEILKLAYHRKQK